MRVESKNCPKPAGDDFFGCNSKLLLRLRRLCKVNSNLRGLLLKISRINAQYTSELCGTLCFPRLSYIQLITHDEYLNNFNIIGTYWIFCCRSLTTKGFIASIYPRRLRLTLSHFQPTLFLFLYTLCTIYLLNH